MNKTKADVIIIGGGLAGLTAAVHLSKHGLQVLLFEKNPYPGHKVCGEYISKEILPYLKTLDIDLFHLQPLLLNRFLFSTQKGESITARLEMGGLGISRYSLDNFLFKKALASGVEVIQDTVISVDFKNKEFHLHTASGKEFKAALALGAFGKRSGMDKTLNRPFIEKRSSWLAVKAHYEHQSFPNDLVALHNFNGGYCGLSKTETGAVNVCYLVTYKSFRKYKNTEACKKNMLYENPYLKKFFTQATTLFEKDLTIAQVTFDKKSLIENHILMIGDAAGLIHPLCGNGMAMAIHSAKIASESILENYDCISTKQNKIQEDYEKEWKKEFRSRLHSGRILQKILLNPNLAEVSQYVVKKFPSLLPKIISRTHGTVVS